MPPLPVPRHEELALPLLPHVPLGNHRLFLGAGVLLVPPQLPALLLLLDALQLPWWELRWRFLSLLGRCRLRRRFWRRRFWRRRLRRRLRSRGRRAGIGLGLGRFDAYVQDALHLATQLSARPKHLCPVLHRNLEARS